MDKHITSRRAVLTGAAGVAAAGALAAVPAQATERSPEFLKWCALATRTGEALEATDAWEHECIRQGKERSSGEYPIDLHWDAMQVLEDEIFARPVRSWIDVGELALIATYWSGDEKCSFGKQNDPNDPDADLDKDCSTVVDRSRAHLMYAAMKLMGGVHA